MLSDIEISRNAAISPIGEIARSIFLDPDSDIELYGKYKAKLTEEALAKLAKSEKTGKLILVTAMTPTKYGEGKTTMSIGLGQALALLGYKTAITLREPSLGPVFGMKGGATGGGYSQVAPMDDINLHFTGDLHAITAANNLLCAILDNHIYQGNQLGIDPENITFSRCMDTNDRALKDITIGLGGKKIVPRKDGFRITAASEIMAVFCLAENLAELKAMLGDICVGYTFGGEPVFARDLKVEGSMCALLKDAFRPNLVQTLEGVPVFIHGGPFANIAHGCNSVRATKAAQKLADYTVTEAGFGSDLGAEKFFDIKCRKAGLEPDAAVLVATVRAIRHHGGGDMARGFFNVLAHVENLRRFNMNPVLAVNRFFTDTKEELAELSSLCERHGIPFSFSSAFEKGGEGSVELAKKVAEICAAPKKGKPRFAYEPEDTIKQKIEKIAVNIYGAARVIYSQKAEEALARVKQLNLERLPVCMAKTQYSFSDDPALTGRPADFELNVRDMAIQTGAGFIVAMTGDVMIMPGLPKVPNAEIIDVGEDGNIINLS
ncbi:MAG: formate--tetrahydrofolate ligase [Oscillospiraceae bacterium]|nr:formate--tetrahydrofolate ligase [Oscillospiraceae bacterium]